MLKTRGYQLIYKWKLIWFGKMKKSKVNRRYNFSLEIRWRKNVNYTEKIDVACRDVFTIIFFGIDTKNY